MESRPAGLGRRLEASSISKTEYHQPDRQLAQKPDILPSLSLMVNYLRAETEKPTSKEAASSPEDSGCLTEAIGLREKAGIETGELSLTALRRNQLAIETIELHLGGLSMQQASLEAGCGATWLTEFKRSDPEQFNQLLAEACERAGIEIGTEPTSSHELRNRHLATRAIELYANGGLSLRQVSRQVGCCETFLSNWKHHHPEEFRQLFNEAFEKRRLSFQRNRDNSSELTNPTKK